MDTRYLSPLLFLTLPLLAAAAPAVSSATTPTLETTAPDDLAVCIYRISGTYSPINRWIFYASILISASLRHSKWVSGPLLAAAMLYSSVAVVHAWVILGNSGLNPEVLDTDIIAISTIVASTYFFTAPLMVCGAAFHTKARNVLIFWSVFLWLGCNACCAATWILEKDVSSAAHVKPLCQEIKTDGTPGEILSEAIQLKMRDYNFTCTYTCFSSTRSVIREVDNIYAVPSTDIYSYYLVLLPRFTLASCIAVPLVALLALIRIIEKTKQPPRRSETMAKARWISEMLCIGPGLGTVLVGEAALLRRDGVLKSESYRSVGQWSGVVCVGLVVIVSLIIRFVTRNTLVEDTIECCILRSKKKPRDIELNGDVT